MMLIVTVALALFRVLLLDSLLLAVLAKSRCLSLLTFVSIGTTLGDRNARPLRFKRRLTVLWCMFSAKCTQH